MFYNIFLSASLIFFTLPLAASPLEPINVFSYLQRVNELRYTPLDLSSAKVTSRQNLQGCEIDNVQFAVNDPLTSLSHDVSVSLYHPIQSGKYPAVILVPTIRGRTIVETSIAYRFCQNHIVTAIADVNDLGAPAVLPDWQMHDRDNRAVVIDLRNLIDLLEHHNQVNPLKIGAYGLSLGAYSVALLASVDSRLSMVALVAGAGNMPAILSYSAQSIPVRLRTLRMTALNDSSLIDYENNLRANVLLDPIYLTKNPDTKKYFMLMDLTDLDVPTANQYELWEALGRPDHLDVRLTHPETIVSAATIHFDEILKNIVSRFEE